MNLQGFPGISDGKEFACNAGRPRLNPSIWKTPLEKRMATHSSILAWRNPWTKEIGRSMRPQSWTQLSNEHFFLLSWTYYRSKLELESKSPDSKTRVILTLPKCLKYIINLFIYGPAPSSPFPFNFPSFSYFMVSVIYHFIDLPTLKFTKYLLGTCNKIEQVCLIFRTKMWRKIRMPLKYWDFSFKRRKRVIPNMESHKYRSTSYTVLTMPNSRVPSFHWHSNSFFGNERLRHIEQDSQSWLYWHFGLLN